MLPARSRQASAACRSSPATVVSEGLGLECLVGTSSTGRAAVSSPQFDHSELTNRKMPDFVDAVDLGLATSR